MSYLLGYGFELHDPSVKRAFFSFRHYFLSCLVARHLLPNSNSDRIRSLRDWLWSLRQALVSGISPVFAVSICRLGKDNSVSTLRRPFGTLQRHPNCHVNGTRPDEVGIRVFRLIRYITQPSAPSDPRVFLRSWGVFVFEVFVLRVSDVRSATFY